jgi:hypothetical protein
LHSKVSDGHGALVFFAEDPIALEKVLLQRPSWIKRKESGVK